MRRIRILLADDHPILLDGLRCLLAVADIEVVGAVSDGRALVQAAGILVPDVIVVDIEMPVLNGIEAAREIHVAGGRAKIIFLTMHTEAFIAARAIAAGGSGYVLKSSAGGELVKAIREVWRGGTFLAPEVQEGVLKMIRHPKSGAATASLNTRQIEILELLATGRAAKEIAGILKISTKTLDFHKQRLMEFVGVHSVAELIVFAVNEGIVGQASGFAGADLRRSLVRDRADLQREIRQVQRDAQQRTRELSRELRERYRRW